MIEDFKKFARENPRVASAVTGAKLGVSFGMRAGPAGMVKGALAGAAIGYVGGAAVTDRVSKWLGKDPVKPK